MISVMPSFRWKKGDKPALRKLLGYERAVYISGMQVEPYKPWEGWVDDIPYGVSIVVKEGRTAYSFKRKTDNTVEVF